MLSNKSDIIETGRQKVFKQRVLMTIAGLALFFVTYYGYGITSKRVSVLNSGTIVKTQITRTTSKRTLRTYFVSIDNIEYDAGDDIPGRASVGVGDTVSVYHKVGIKYVVPLGKTSYLSMTIFQYVLFCIAPLLILSGLLYPTERILKNMK